MNQPNEPIPLGDACVWAYTVIPANRHKGLLQFLVIISIHYLNPSTQELIQTKNHIPPSQQYLDFQLELIQNLQNSGESVTEIQKLM
jgi:hypothetical protein